MDQSLVGISEDANLQLLFPKEHQGKALGHTYRNTQILNTSAMALVFNDLSDSQIVSFDFEYYCNAYLFGMGQFCPSPPHILTWPPIEPPQLSKYLPSLETILLVSSKLVMTRKWTLVYLLCYVGSYPVLRCIRCFWTLGRSSNNPLLGKHVGNYWMTML